jgi:putative ABC transport system permease protein
LSLRGASYLLALLAITVGTTVIATMLNLEAGLAAKMSSELRRYGPNLLVMPVPIAARGTGTPTLEEDSARGLASRLGGADTVAVPLLIAAGTVTLSDAGRGLGGRRGGAPGAAAIVGADFEALRRLQPSWRVEGAWPATGAAGGTRTAGTGADGGPGASPCLLGAALARRAGVEPGRSVVLRVGESEQTLAVAGVVSTGEAEEEQVFVPLKVLQEMTGLPGRVSLVALSVDGGAEAVARAGRAAQAAIGGSVARALPQIAASQGAILGKLNRMMLLLTAVVLGLSGICLVTTLMSMVIEREGEIGLIRSLGGGDGEILRMFVGEVVILGLLGALVGLVFGAAGARFIGARLFGAAIEARAGVVPTVLAASLVLCLVAVLVPLRRALAVQPAAALRGE